VVRTHFGGQQLVARGETLGIALAHLGLGLVRDARGHGSARREDDRHLAERRRPDEQPGTILSQMPNNMAPSKASCDSATTVASAITSRLNSDSSMPSRPCVTPSHMAGTRRRPVPWRRPAARRRE
jgi:hypothetical protein